jgi:hypothetical protein
VQPARFDAATGIRGSLRPTTQASRWGKWFNGIGKLCDSLKAAPKRPPPSGMAPHAPLTLIVTCSTAPQAASQGFNHS